MPPGTLSATIRQQFMAGEMDVTTNVREIQIALLELTLNSLVIITQFREQRLRRDGSHQAAEDQLEEVVDLVIDRLGGVHLVAPSHGAHDTV